MDRCWACFIPEVNGVSGVAGVAGLGFPARRRLEMEKPSARVVFAHARRRAPQRQLEAQTAALHASPLPPPILSPNIPSDNTTCPYTTISRATRNRAGCVITHGHEGCRVQGTGGRAPANNPPPAHRRITPGREDYIAHHCRALLEDRLRGAPMIARRRGR